jgi:hypothetical protein
MATGSKGQLTCSPMKTLGLLLILFSTTAWAGPVHVRSHTTRRGSYVQPHARTSPDHSRSNNWSTRGNVNPYTGKRGTKTPYARHR